MYAYYKQLHPPTGVENSVFCHFFSKEEKNLVVSKATELTVYRLIKNAEVPSAKKSDQGPSEIQDKERLEELASYQLYARVSSMKSAPVSGAGRDALLLAFSDAKLSIVEYDPNTHDLRTLSMHHFEEEELKEGYYCNPYPPILEVDPDNRCAVMLIYGSKLVVLPFRRDAKADDLSQGFAGSKSSIMPSYTIKLTDVDSHLMNILDFKFLHGYYEPTLVLLHEPVRTWAGRVAVRHDTCAIVALSLSISQKVHPIIWSQSSLPYDCSKMLAVPKPIGGVLILATNSLLYLNQSIPPYGVSLNSITDWSTTFPLRKQEKVSLTLDCAQATFITNERVVISLNGGEIYVLTLLVDGLRTMRGFHLDKAASSVLTACICLVEKNYLFLGSRLGNSLLLKFSEKTTGASKSQSKEPPAKRMRGGASDWTASKPRVVEDQDELEVYGREVQRQDTQVSSYSFEVCDSLLNIGPCAIMEIGEPAILSDEFQGSSDSDIELVICSGYGKNGALSILQRTIRPQIVTTFQLPGCLDMWTVYGSKIKKEEPREADQMTDAHSYLILSKEDSTMVLETGQEIAEIDESGFSTQAPTIFAGNVGNNKYIVQVSPMGVRLLDGVLQLQHIPLDLGSPITLCSIADPYVVIMSANGDVILLTLKEEQHGKGHKLTIHKPVLNQHSQIIAISAYPDRSGIFVTSSKESSGMWGEETGKDQSTGNVPGLSNKEEPTTIDDEEELLYGTSEPEILKMDTAESSSKNVEKPRVEMKVETTHWCTVCRENGKLEIFHLPDFQPVFMVRNFPMAQKILVDNVQSINTTNMEQPQQQSHQNLPKVKEILMVGLGNKTSRPYLMAIIDEDLIIYEAFSFCGMTHENHLKLRFRKVPHSILMREKKKRKKADQDSEELKSRLRQVSRLRPFSDVSSYSGVFICGPYPHWICVTSRGALRTHAMFVDGPVSSFTGFHNINCPRGFLYFNFKGELRVSVLPSHFSYDADWLTRKIGMRCTVHFITYHLDSKTYAVVTSNLEPCKHIVRFNNDERELEEIERDERFINSTKEKFALQLYSPLNWEPIPNTRIEYDLSEHVTCLKVVSLQTEDSIDKKNFLAVGTSQVYSEDFSAKGRVYIYSVIDVVPEPGQPLTKHKLKVAFEQDQKGALSSLCDVKGQLLTCIGQKVYLWTVKDNELVGLAFMDTQIYINNAVSLKHFVLITDICKSVFLLQYQEEHRTLALVSKDSKPLEVYSCAFLVHDNHLGFLASDADRNLIILHYHPEARESYGGTRLLRRGDINISSHVNTFQRIACNTVDPASGLAIGGPVRHIAFFATLDGGLGMLLPMSEKIYRRLLMLQNTLMTAIPHLCGLNPRACRHIMQGKKTLNNPHRNIIDGDLIWKYALLSVTEKNEIARRIGSNPEQIMDDLMDIERATYRF